MAKVMVVDDAYSELKLMESILTSAGLEVAMPNRNGYEIFRSLKRDERTKSTPGASSSRMTSPSPWSRRFSCASSPR